VNDDLQWSVLTEAVLKTGRDKFLYISAIGMKAKQIEKRLVLFFWMEQRKEDDPELVGKVVEGYDFIREQLFGFYRIAERCNSPGQVYHL
jgi:hypothetical protein